MDLHTSVSENSVDVGMLPTIVLPLCELAKSLEEAGEFERAAETSTVPFGPDCCSSRNERAGRRR